MQTKGDSYLFIYLFFWKPARNPLHHFVGRGGGTLCRQAGQTREPHSGIAPLSLETRTNTHSYFFFRDLRIMLLNSSLES